jgi:hypothetical protein
MKKTSFFVLALIILSNQISYAGAIFSENFTTDPGWTSTEPDNVKWDSAGFYRAKVSDNPTDWVQYGYSSVFQEISNTSFTLEFDINPISPSYGTYPQLALTTDGADNYFDSQPLSIGAEIADDLPQVFVMRGKPYSESSPIYLQSDTFDAGEWYHQQVNYNAENDTLIWKIYDSSGSLFHNGTYTNVSVCPFNQVAVGYKGNSPVYGYGWAEIYVDNITIIPEPATIVLLTLGGLALRKKRI